MPHRIAVLFEYPTLNGGERSMLQTLDRIDTQEFELVALAPRNGRLAEALRGTACRHVPFELQDAEGHRLSRDKVCQQLLTTIRDLRADLLHANSLSMGRLTGSVAGQLAVPCLAHLRDIIGLSKSAINDLNQNQSLIAVSQATRDFHVAQGLSPDRTRVEYNGVDSERFRPRPNVHSLHRELDLPEDCFVILTIGQIGLRKGQDVLAAAAPLIARQVPGAQFVIVGERNSSKLESVAFEANLSATFAAAGLASQLHLLGYRPDVDQLMNDADLLVHPAKQEPFGRVLLEAAASGLPIVATNVGGTPEMVTDGVTARLVPPCDHRQLAAAAIELLSNDVLRHQLAAAAREHVVSQFSPDHVASRVTTLWRESLTTPR